MKNSLATLIHWLYDYNIMMFSTCLLVQVRWCQRHEWHPDGNNFPTMKLHDIQAHASSTQAFLITFLYHATCTIQTCMNKTLQYSYCRHPQWCTDVLAIYIREFIPLWLLPDNRPIHRKFLFPNQQSGLQWQTYDNSHVRVVPSPV